MLRLVDPYNLTTFTGNQMFGLIPELQRLHEETNHQVLGQVVELAERARREGYYVRKVKLAATCPLRKARPSLLRQLLVVIFWLHPTTRDSRVQGVAEHGMALGTGQMALEVRPRSRAPGDAGRRAGSLRRGSTPHRSAHRGERSPRIGAPWRHPTGRSTSRSGAGTARPGARSR